MQEGNAVVVGAGLAGCEAALALASRGVDVALYDIKPSRFTPAHKYAGFAELVCSNSLKSDDRNTASGMLKTELELLGSVVMRAAKASAVPAGGALAVTRDRFSDFITDEIRQNPRIRVINEEVTDLPPRNAVIAAGPLATDTLARAIQHKLGYCLSFYDASAPIVYANSVDYTKAFFGGRYGRGDDYLNCPLNKEEYAVFHEALVTAETAPLHEFDRVDGGNGDGGKVDVFEGCMPVEILAKRGADSVRYGCMKPVGLNCNNTRPYAVVQLRAENADKTMYNLVGFQTNLKFAEQKRVFGLIPALANAEYARYGVMHRNTFLNSPKWLDSTFRLRGSDNVYFAGQISGVEGYVESAASGLMAGIALARELRGEHGDITPPPETVIGALARHISTENANFQPMNANMGILPPLGVKIRDKKERYAAFELYLSLIIENLYSQNFCADFRDDF